GIEVGIFDERAFREPRRLIALCLEAALNMAGADAQLEHHWRARGLRQLESLLHHLDDLAPVGAGVAQPDPRLHREGMAALLDDRGALAVVLAEHDQRAGQ